MESDSHQEEQTHDAGPAPDRRRKGVPPYVRLVGVVLFVAILARIDLAQVSRSLGGIGWVNVLAAALLCAGVVVTKGLRWHVLIDRMGARESRATSLVVYGDSIFWGTLTPGRLGEFRKIQHLHRRHGVRWARGVWWSLMDRGFDLLGLMLLAGLSVSLVARASGERTLLLPVALAGVGAVVFLLGYRRLLRAGIRLLAKVAERRTAWLRKAAEDLLGLNHGSVVVLLLLSVCALFLYIAMVGTLARGLPFALEPAQLVVCVTATMAAGLLPISYFNLGSREAVLLLLFRGFGLRAEEAIGFSLLFMICYVILMFETALFWWLARRTAYGAGPS